MVLHKGLGVCENLRTRMVDPGVAAVKWLRL